MPEIDIINRTRAKISEARIRNLAASIMTLIPEIRGARVEIVFTGERGIRALNSRYRGKDMPTDVLSFRVCDPKEAFGEPFGSIVICPKIAEKYSKRDSVPFNDMLDELVLHSLLHLTGSDHETEADHRAMERRRKRILKKLAEIQNTKKPPAV